MIITVVNQKGGVGKTTITINLARSLSLMGKKILVIDIDPQANCTTTYCPKIPKDRTIGELLINLVKDIDDVILPAQIIDIGDELKNIENLYIIPSTIHLAVTADSISGRHHREKILYKHLQRVEKKYDLILIDSPPSFGVFSINAIYAAERFVIPVNYSKYSLDGVDDLFRSIREIKEVNSISYKILRSMRDSRTRRTNLAIESALESFQTFKTVIRKVEAINQAQMSDIPIYDYDSRSDGVKDFDNLAREIINE